MLLFAYLPQLVCEARISNCILVVKIADDAPNRAFVVVGHEMDLPRLRGLTDDHVDSD